MSKKISIDEYIKTSNYITAVYHNKTHVSESILDFKNNVKEFLPIFLESKLHKNYMYTCPFSGISLSKMSELIPEEKRNIVFSDMIKINSPIEKFINLLRISLEKILLEEIKDDEKYLFFHSSGYDSRIISLTMMSLRDRGIKDFRNVFFLCHQPEEVEFLKIMELEGWDKSQYGVASLPTKDSYNIGSFISVNGWNSYYHQMDFFSQNFQIKDYHLISGICLHLSQFIERQDPKTIINNRLDNIMSHLKGRGCETVFSLQFKGAVFPFFHHNWLKIFRLYQPEYTHPNNKDLIRESLIRRHGVQFLGLRSPKGKYGWNISEKRKTEMNEQFLASRFYSDFKTLLPKKLDFFTCNIKSWEAHLWGFAVTVYGKMIGGNNDTFTDY